MSVILFFTVFIINIFLMIYCKENKWIAIVSVGILLLIYAGNNRTGFADLTYYRSMYYSMRYTDEYEKGYVAFANFFSSIGMNFNVFLGLVFLICVILLTFVVKSHTNHYAPVIALMSGFYYFYSLEVVRFFIANSILLVALELYYRRKPIIGSAILLLASQFHRYAYVFFLLLPLSFVSNKEKLLKIYKIIGISSCVLSLFIFLSGNNTSFIGTFFSRYFIGTDYEGKFGYFQSRTRYGFILFFWYQFVNYIFILCCNKIIESLPEDLVTKDQLNYMFFCKACVYALCVALPLTMVNTTFVRYFISISLMTYILFGECHKLTNYQITNNYNRYEYSESLRGNRIIVFNKYILIMIAFYITAFIDWWYYKINVLGMIDQLQANIFF